MADQESEAHIALHMGRGGPDARAWVLDLLGMYVRYARRRLWTVRIEDLAGVHDGGIDQVRLAIRGAGVWEQLKEENGVFRVQRAPQTMPGYRIHTSTANVSVWASTQRIGETVETRQRPENARTFCYPDNRVTDHRRRVTVDELDRVVDGELDLLLNASAV